MNINSLDKTIDRKITIFNDDNVTEGPIDISITGSIECQCPPLLWCNYETLPKKLKLFNTGKAVHVAGRWAEARPSLRGGPLQGAGLGGYVFSQMHFHWPGSLHTVDGMEYLMEMHVVHFNSDYLFPHIAKKEKDGLAIVVYLFKLQFYPNRQWDYFIKCLDQIQDAGSSFEITPMPLNAFFEDFEGDYFVYRDSINVSKSLSNAMWIIPRHPIGMSLKQASSFKKMLNSSKKPIVQKSKEIQHNINKRVYFINPSRSKIATMLRPPF